MVKLFARLFIKNYQDTTDQHVRTSYGKMGGIFGIVTNFLLCSFKIVSGILTNSIAVIAEGINNLSDAGSSIITLVGFKLSSAPADREHPYGHQRMEYVAGLIVSMVILIIGINLAFSSFQKIINPTPVKFSYYVIIILAVSIVVKFIQTGFYRRIGRIINSQTMIATSSDSLNDVIATTTVLFAIIVAQITGLNLDGYMGVAVSIFIIFSGIGLVKGTMNPLIGAAPEDGFVEMLIEKILGYEGVLGLHDLVVHSYGPNKTFVTAHVEVASDVNINISHDIIDNIEHDFKHEFGIDLVIHMDPIDNKDQETIELRDKIKVILESIDEQISFHDFRVVKGVTHTNLIFDVVIPPVYRMTPDEVENLIKKKIKAYDSRLNAVITVDQSYGLNLSREN